MSESIYQEFLKCLKQLGIKHEFFECDELKQEVIIPIRQLEQQHRLTLHITNTDIGIRVRAMFEYQNRHAIWVSHQVPGFFQCHGKPLGMQENKRYNGYMAVNPTVTKLVELVQWAQNRAKNANPQAFGKEKPWEHMFPNRPWDK